MLSMPPFLVKLRAVFGLPHHPLPLLVSERAWMASRHASPARQRGVAKGTLWSAPDAIGAPAPSPHPGLVLRLSLGVAITTTCLAGLLILGPGDIMPGAWTLPATLMAVVTTAISLMVLAVSLRRNRQDAADLARWRVTLNAMSETILETRQDGTILFFHDTPRQPMLPFPGMPVLGRKLQDLLGNEHDIGVLLQQSFTTGRAHSREIPVNLGGSNRWYELSLTRVAASNDEPLRHMILARDITQTKGDEEAILHLAHHDQLTGLLNRRLLIDRLSGAMQRARRTGSDGALFFLDLDNFKSLNDTLGHDFGDVLLQQVAIRLKACAQEADTVARFGGDEFVLLIEQLTGNATDRQNAAYAICDRILLSLNRPYDLGGRSVHSSPSIGVILFSTCPDSAEDLLSKADIAMYQAKKDGRNTARLFDPDMQRSMHWRATVESEMHLALQRRQLQLFYQPQVDQDGNTVGAEALLRWHHDELKWISPDQFIRVAEEVGLIIPIGQWVLETACAQLRQWSRDPQTANLHIGINISAKQFRQPDFIERVTSVIDTHRVNPTLIYLELTESMLFDNIEDTVARMNALKALGVRFSLDDFGTGYSSLQYLRTLPLDQLKIDQSFVRELNENNADVVIVDTIIAMAHHLKLDVIAEGVETQIQRDLLNGLGCQRFQGHLFGKPVPVEQFDPHTREQKK
jgi:diguanylate cyclase (GGDEF)-like protein